LNANKDNYRLEVLDIVTDSLLLANQSHIAKPEKVAMAHVWTDALIEIIPQDELQNVFKKAVELHKGNYPLNAFSLKNAWNHIEANKPKELSDEQRKVKETYDAFYADFKKPIVKIAPEVEEAQRNDIAETFRQIRIKMGVASSV
jgi:hypothetical protein